MANQITIMGAGQIGRAVGKILSVKKYHVEFWDSVSGKVENQSKLSDIVPDSELVLLCTPSWALRTALESIKPYFSPKNVLVCFSKGMEADTADFTHEVIEGVANEVPYALFGGSMIAETLDLGGAGCVASKSEDVFEKIGKVFDKSPVYVDYSNDIMGVAACGVLKNIYSLGMGLVDGLGFGENIRGWLAAVALGEMVEIVRQLGGEEKTAMGIAGAADFISTGFSFNSNNRRIGEALATTGKIDPASESVVSLEPLMRRLDNKVAAFKFLDKISEVVLGGEKPKIGLREFLSVAPEYLIDND